MIDGLKWQLLDLLTRGDLHGASRLLQRHALAPVPLLALSIPGQPLGKQRPRVTRTGHAFTPQKTINWETSAAWLLAEAWAGREPLDCPVWLEVMAVKSRPKRLLRARDPEFRVWRLTKPDGDNVLKIAADALVKAGVVRDDTVIARWELWSLFTAKNEGPRVEIKISTLPEHPPSWVEDLKL